MSQAIERRTSPPSFSTTCILPQNRFPLPSNYTAIISKMYSAHLPCFRFFRIAIWQRGDKFQKKIGLKYSRIIYNFKQKNWLYFAFPFLKIKNSLSTILASFSAFFPIFFQPLYTLFISRYPLFNFPSAPLRSSSSSSFGISHLQ